MIDCRQYRRALLADPAHAAPEWAAHRESCASCAEFTARLRSFEDRLARAVRLPAPAGQAVAEGERPGGEVLPLRPGGARGPRGHRGPERAWDRRGFMRRGRFALAASVLLGAGLAAILWLAVPRSSLADDVVAHMAGEPDAWRSTGAAVPAPALAAVLREAHVRLSKGAGVVSYARSCSFRGHRVPHLVVQGADGPATVMVLVHEKVPGEAHFDEQGYRGVIVPVAGHGALAVLMQVGGADSKSVERIAAQLIASIEWTT